MKKFTINRLDTISEHLVMIAPLETITAYNWKHLTCSEELLFTNIELTKTLPSCLIIDLDLFSNLDKLKELIQTYSFSTNYFIYKLISHDKESAQKVVEFNNWFSNLIFPKKLK